MLSHNDIIKLIQFSIDNKSEIINANIGNRYFSESSKSKYCLHVTETTDNQSKIYYLRYAHPCFELRIKFTSEYIKKCLETPMFIISGQKETTLYTFGNYNNISINSDAMELYSASEESLFAKNLVLNKCAYELYLLIKDLHDSKIEYIVECTIDNDIKNFDINKFYKLYNLVIKNINHDQSK